MGAKKKRIKKLFWSIIILIIFFIILITFILKNQGGITEDSLECVPATCCHPTECVSSEQAPDCSEIFCTAVCFGPLDCGAGNCEAINGKCEVVSND